MPTDEKIRLSLYRARQKADPQLPLPNRMTTMRPPWQRTLQTLAVAAWSLSAALPQSSAATAVQVDATKTLGRLEPFWASQIVHPTEFLLTEWGQRYVSRWRTQG